MNVLHSGLSWTLQTDYSRAVLFSRNKLFSHASAAAYYFLLAIGPLILVLVSVLNTSLISYPELTAELFELLARFNPQLNEDFFRRIGVLQA